MSSEPIDIQILRSIVADLRRENDTLRELVADSVSDEPQHSDPRERVCDAATTFYAAIENVFDDWAIQGPLNEIKLRVANLVANAPLAKWDNGA
jgi:hypothetical protein